MKQLLIVGYMVLWVSTTLAQNTSFDEKARIYVKQYAAWAIEEQRRAGIPAAITLAQGIHETNAGESELATLANNHFGIKCKKEWRGETFAHTDDAPNECFRKYPSAKESYIDHSNYLKNSVRYAELFSYEPTNYHAWAKGLKKCGYATNPAYAQKLIKMVEDYQLQQYTIAAIKGAGESIPTQDADRKTVAALENQTPKMTDLVLSSNTLSSSTLTPEERSVVYVNNIKAIFCKKGETLLDKAIKYNIRYEKLLEINELSDEPLSRDMYVYLAPKNNKGAHPTHIVVAGETLEQIAHDEGMTSRQLRIFNLIAQNEQAVVGSVLKLQEQSEMRPETYKFSRAQLSKPTSPQKFNLMDQSASATDNDFVPTKKEKLSQATEEVEIGYGAERPAFLAQPQNQDLSRNDALIRDTNARHVTVEQMRLTSVQEEKKSAANEPLDEIAQLKARLDKAVYAKATKSNIKVHSSDSLGVHLPQIKNQDPVNSTLEVSSPSSVEVLYHVVDKGDTAYSIAKKYGIKIKQLNEWNNLNFDGIKIGQKLRVR